MSETKTGTEEKSLCSETLQKLCNQTGMHFYRTEQSKWEQPVTNSRERKKTGPPAHQIIGLSHSAQFLRQRDFKGHFSVPNSTKFVMRTETPGGFCVNCHHNKERRPERLHQRPEKPVCVYRCACARTYTHTYIYLYKMKTGLYMSF